MGSCELFAWCWLQTSILLISASWVVRITNVTHWYPARNSIFNFLRTHHTVFHLGCTILYSYKQYTRVPISLHSCQHSIFCFFFRIVPILMSVRWKVIHIKIVWSPLWWSLLMLWKQNGQAISLLCSTTKPVWVRGQLSQWWRSERLPLESGCREEDEQQSLSLAARVLGEGELFWKANTLGSPLPFKELIFLLTSRPGLCSRCCHHL
jgi:hypothetical protein